MKKFKLLKILSIFAIAAAGAVAVGVGTKAPKVEAAEAAVASKLYFKPNDDWASSNAWFAVKFTDNTWVKMSETSYSGIYSFTPETHTSGTLCRMNANDRNTLNDNNRWNYTINVVTFDSSGKNFITMTGSGYGDWNYYPTEWSVVNTVSSGFKFFANVEAVSSFWYADNASLYLFTNGPAGYKVMSMSRIGQSNLLVASAPSSGIMYNDLVVLRGQPGFDGSDWSKKWNQSEDLWLNTSNATYNAMYVLSETTYGNQVASLNQLSDNYLIDAFGNYFLGATADYCTSHVLTTSEQTTIKNTLDGISTYSVVDAKAAFANGTIIHSTTGHHNKADEAISRYWDMTHSSKNAKEATYDDFLELGESFMNRTRSVGLVIFGQNENNGLIISIIVISIISVSALAGFYFIRKRKHI